MAELSLAALEKCGCKLLQNGRCFILITSETNLIFIQMSCDVFFFLFLVGWLVVFSLCLGSINKQMNSNNIYGHTSKIEIEELV